MKKKKLVSIIIPTNKRKELLRRSIRYFESDVFNFCNFLIIDSSPKIFKYKFKKNFKYIHYKKNSFSKKIFHTLSKVSTKYCIIVNDDDFIGMNALKKGINFLESNQDYVSYHGEYISFRYLERNNKVLYIAAYSDTLKNNLNFTIDSKVGRVKKLYENRPHWYNALHYTKNLKKSFKIAILGQDIHFSEILIPFVIGLDGKCKVDKVFWYAKDANVYTDVRIRQNKARKKMEKELFIKNSPIKKKLIEMMRLYKVKGNYEESSKIIDDIFRSYFNTYLFEEKKNKTYFNFNLRNTVIKFFPVYLRNLIRLLINFIKSGDIENMDNNIRVYGPKRDKNSLKDWIYMKNIIKQFTDFKDIYKNIK